MHLLFINMHTLSHAHTQSIETLNADRNYRCGNYRWKVKDFFF